MYMLCIYGMYVCVMYMCDTNLYHMFCVWCMSMVYDLFPRCTLSCELELSVDSMKYASTCTSFLFKYLLPNVCVMYTCDAYVSDM